MDNHHHIDFDSTGLVFSLIMATYNRRQEVEDFILSLLNQSFNIKKVELIIIDQNKVDFLDEIVNKYSLALKIIHIRSSTLGPSLNRNIGIKAASGQIIAFPDDDCEYYNDTLESVFNIFKSEQVTTILGQVFNRNNSTKVIRNWPNNKKAVTENNFFFLYTCITIFTTNKQILFCETLGPNTSFGAYEDADYVLSQIKCNNSVIRYYPEVQVNHPKLDIDTMGIKKIQDYGMGFGAFCKKNPSSYIFFIFLSNLILHTIKMLYSAVIFDYPACKRRFYSIISRTKGMYLYKT